MCSDMDNTSSPEQKRNEKYDPKDEQLLGQFSVHRTHRIINDEIDVYHRQLEEEVIHARKFRMWAIEEITKLKEFQSWALHHIRVPIGNRFNNLSASRHIGRKRDHRSILPTLALETVIRLNSIDRKYGANATETEAKDEDGASVMGTEVTPDCNVCEIAKEVKHISSANMKNNSTFE